MAASMLVDDAFLTTITAVNAQAISTIATLAGSWTTLVFPEFTGNQPAIDLRFKVRSVQVTEVGESSVGHGKAKPSKTESALELLDNGMNWSISPKLGISQNKTHTPAFTGFAPSLPMVATAVRSRPRRRRRRAEAGILTIGLEQSINLLT